MMALNIGKLIYKKVIHINILIGFGILLSLAFTARADMGMVRNDKIDEASGIASSINNKNIIWTHNDSGDIARIYAIGLDGSDLGVLKLPGIIALDWEDMCIGPGPKEGADYIYIGDIGNNFSRKKKMKIYRFEEPLISLDSIPIPFDIKIKDVDKITFTYPDGKRDAEALMIDPVTKDLHVITKRELSPHVYSISYPQSTSSVVTAELLGELVISPEKSYRMSDKIVAADMSRDGTMVLVKTLHEIILINRKPDSIFSSILESEQISLDYIIEPQGEAICWNWDQLGYFTISEEPDKIPTHLYYYSK